MRVNVTREKTVITEYTPVNANEVNVNTCEFSLPDCFTGLTVTAMFNSIPVPVERDNTCIIPNLKAGTATLGVYAYREVGDNIDVMYSPEATSFFVGEGSFSENVEVEKMPELGTFELYCHGLNIKFNKAVDRVIGAINEASALVGGASQ